jgi:hypothetical protein
MVRYLWQLSLQAQQHVHTVLGPAKRKEEDVVASCGICSRQGLRYRLAFGERFAGLKTARRPCDLVMLRSFSRSQVVESCLDDSD